MPLTSGKPPTSDAKTPPTMSHPVMSRRVHPLLAGAILLAVTTYLCDATADPIYSVTIGGETPITSPTSVSQSVPGSTWAVDVENPDTGTMSQAGQIVTDTNASAAHGRLGSASSASYSLPSNPGFFATFNPNVGPSNSTASSFIDTIQISGPQGAQTAPYSFNFDISGVLNANVSSNGVYLGNNVNASASARLLYGTCSSQGCLDGNESPGTELGALSVYVGYDDYRQDKYQYTTSATGIFGPFAASGDFPGNQYLLAVTTSSTTPQWTAQNGETVRFWLDLLTAAGAWGAWGSDQPENGIGTAAGSSDFSRTLTFPGSGVVLNLPEGWTANSLDGCIVDNHFVCGSAPEPAAALVGAVSLGSLLALARRRRFANSIRPAPA